jgi:hypothetical protein
MKRLIVRLFKTIGALPLGSFVQKASQRQSKKHQNKFGRRDPLNKRGKHWRPASPD